MSLKSISIFVIIIFFGLTGYSVAEEKLTHGDNKLLDKSSKYLFRIFGSPDVKKEKVMPDGMKFITLYYSLGNVSYVVDMKRDAVCGISLSMDEDGYCYPCEYEKGVCH